MNNMRNGIYGLIVGDALGVPVQFMTRNEIRNRDDGSVVGMEAGGVYNVEPGTWSDDSSMALALLDSINNCGEIDIEDIMNNFTLWLYNGDYTPFGESFDVGNTCLSAINSFRRDGNANTCGVIGEYANGNGALMRVLPLCIYLIEKNFSDNESITYIHSESSLTHNHLRSNMCCGIYYFICKSIIERNSNSLNELIQNGVNYSVEYYGKNQDKYDIKELTHLSRIMFIDKLKQINETDIKSDGYVVSSIEAAIWCLTTTNSYKDCMLKAVNLGFDTDTVAAIAGGLAGLYYGYDNIPNEWIEVIKNKELIDNIVN